METAKGVTIQVVLQDLLQEKPEVRAPANSQQSPHAGRALSQGKLKPFCSSREPSQPIPTLPAVASPVESMELPAVLPA